jgi:ribulose-bisphosphate carboxylase large chain
LQYLDFIDLDYTPQDEDLICHFKMEPAEGISLKAAAARVGSESSVGTWVRALATETGRVEDRIRRISAKVFEMKEDLVKIAYPPELFEPGNMPQILSSIAGNVFGMKAVDALRLEDVEFPPGMINSFPGPKFGIDGVREIFDEHERPLTASVPKPKVGLTADEHVEAGYEIWTGGVDLLKDDENLTDQDFNSFEDRLTKSFRMRDKAEQETGEKKSYLINITAETDEMKRRAEAVADHGGEYVMIDIITAGWAALQTLRETCGDLGLAIHAHRAMHATFTRRNHGVSMLVVAKVARLLGVDQIHTGTVIGKLETPKEEVLGINDFLREPIGVKSTFPVASGGLHPGLIPELLEILGTDIVIQLGGGIHGHPDGSLAGAKALRQAVDAAMSGIDIKDYAEEHGELAVALEEWGYTKPK